MIPAPKPVNEEQRLALLHELDILDTVEEQAYDDITDLAAQVCGVPISLISLIDEDRQFLKSHHGIDVNEVSRELGLCPHAILNERVTVIEDATKDERFHDNPLVTGDPNVRFYAGAPLIMQDDVVVGTLCIVSDEPRSLPDDQRKTLEILARQVVSQFELRRTVKHLKTASQHKSQFLSSMSHELRTPLNSIIGFGQLLAEDVAGLNDTKPRYVRKILDGGKHLLELIDQILDLSQIESGYSSISIDDVFLPILVDDCIAISKPAADARGVTLASNVDERGPLRCRADERQLRQVLLNLLSNAIKYNSADGSARVSAATTSEGAVRISVRDTGFGIAPEQLPHLFEPFNRLGYESSNIQGSGIGLTIAKQLTEMMSGRIGCESLIDVGTTFWVELPTA